MEVFEIIKSKYTKEQLVLKRKIEVLILFLTFVLWFPLSIIYICLKFVFNLFEILIDKTGMYISNFSLFLAKIIIKKPSN